MADASMDADKCFVFEDLMNTWNATRIVVVAGVV